MLQIKLGPGRTIKPQEDELQPGRPRLGYHPDLSEEEAWRIGRGTWVLNADRTLDQDEVQVISPDGTILAVARLTGLSKHGKRRMLEGTLLAGNPRVGTKTTTPHTSRNPVAYV